MTAPPGRACDLPRESRRWSATTAPKGICPVRDDVFTIPSLTPENVPGGLWRRGDLAGANVPGFSRYVRTVKAIILVLAGLVLGLGSSQATSAWRPLDLPVKGNLISAEFLNGRFFVVDESGAVLVSSNLEDWTFFLERGGEPLQDMAHHDGTYVVVSLSGKVFSGAPGSWTMTEVPAPFGLESVDYGSGRFVAVGRGGVIVSSTDGKEWKPVPSLPDGIRIKNLGWVHFGDGHPENGVFYSNKMVRDYGVNNDGRGNLSGWAWSESVGWINFKGTQINKEEKQKKIS